MNISLQNFFWWLIYTFTSTPKEDFFKILILSKLVILAPSKPFRSSGPCINIFPFKRQHNVILFRYSLCMVTLYSSGLYLRGLYLLKSRLWWCVYGIWKFYHNTFWKKPTYVNSILKWLLPLRYYKPQVVFSQPPFWGCIAVIITISWCSKRYKFFNFRPNTYTRLICTLRIDLKGTL